MIGKDVKTMERNSRGFLAKGNWNCVRTKTWPRENYRPIVSLVKRDKIPGKSWSYTQEDLKVVRGMVEDVIKLSVGGIENIIKPNSEVIIKVKNSINDNRNNFLFKCCSFLFINYLYTMTLPPLTTI